MHCGPEQSRLQAYVLGRSLVLLFAMLTHSQARGKVNDLKSQNDVVLSHSANIVEDWRTQTFLFLEAHPEKTGEDIQHLTSE